VSTVRDFAGLEDALLARLKADVAYARSETYAGQLDDVVEGRLVEFPLITIMFNGERFEEVDGPQHYSTVEFAVGVFAHSLRGEEETRKGQGGAYQLVRDVLQSVVNARLADNVDTVRPIGVSLLYATPTVMAYRIDFSVGMDITFDWPA
jgi:phage gp37-like protein